VADGEYRIPRDSRGAPDLDLIWERLPLSFDVQADWLGSLLSAIGLGEDAWGSGWHARAIDTALMLLGEMRQLHAEQAGAPWTGN